MANLFRLILALLCVSGAQLAHAVITPSTMYTISAQGVTLGPFSTPTAACGPWYSAMLAANPSWVGNSSRQDMGWAPSAGGSGNGTCNAGNGTSSFIAGIIGTVSGSCPANSTKTGSGASATCVCNAPDFEEKDGQCRPKNPCPDGQHEEGGVCVPDKCKPDEKRVNGICVKDPDDNCPEGQTKVNGKCEEACPKRGTFAGEYEVANETPTSFCENKCTVSISTFLRAMKDGKVVSIVGMGHYTGGRCNGPDYTPPDPDKPNKPGDDDGPGDGDGPGDDDGPGDGDGDGPGGPGTPGNPGDPGTPGNPGDPPTQPEPPKPPNRPDKCPNGDCTGTDGGVGLPGKQPPGDDGECPDGFYRSGDFCFPEDPPPEEPDDDGKCPPGYFKVNGVCVPYQPTPDDEREEMDEFCKKNPDSIICKQSTFTGACESGFQCEGDAMICAIARDQHSRNCRLFDNKSPESELYEKEKGKEGAQTSDLPGNREESLMNRISTADAFGAGQCIQDLNIVVVGKAVTLPMSKICPILAVIGNIMVGVALLLAVRIVGRG